MIFFVYVRPECKNKQGKASLVNWSPKPQICRGFNACSLHLNLKGHKGVSAW